MSNLIKAGMALALILVMTLIGVALKWGMAEYGIWLGFAFGAVGIYIAHLIDKADARKATGSPPPDSRDRAP